MEIGRDHVLAHSVIFGARHTEATPPFHHEIIRDWHSDIPNVLTLAFRGGGKSTLAEEATTIEACFGRIRNGLILGESEQRAVERLRAIKNHIETNEVLQAIFEVGPGDIWTEAKVTLSNGVMLQAYGRGQSLRGVKHLDVRPDWLLMDDIETADSVATPEAREKTKQWYVSVVVPAMTPAGRKRYVATPLHPQALAPSMANAASWKTRVYPVIYLAESGHLTATWPERYDIAWAEAKQAEMADIGQADVFVQEYMCQAQNPATRTFTPEMIRVEPRLRSWHAVYAMYDPARTTHAKSATTGKAVWSWVGRRLVIWDGFAKKIMPDEIVADMFEVDNDYRPVAIGIEKTGLDEWLQQPIRAQQAIRGHIIPVRSLHAPKGKLDFIRGLQPYFRAGEVEFARDMPDLRDQLLGFPNGAIDFPNALAYALRMRAGLPVYDNFSAEHICEEITPTPRAPLWLALNSNGAVTTAALVQVAQGQLSIFADWLAEGPPGDALADIILEAELETPSRKSYGGKIARPQIERVALRAVAPRSHFEAYGSIGLVIAARKVPQSVQRGGDIAKGREEIRRFLKQTAHGQPGLRVASRAGWTLRALSGGFARAPEGAEPEDNSYRILLEGIESFAGMLRGEAQDDRAANIDYTASGRQFISARAR